MKKNLLFVKSESFMYKYLYLRESRIIFSHFKVLPEYQAQISQQSRTKNQYNTAISKIFTRYDVVETSYHFLCQRIDLHLCDDAGSK